MASTSHPPAWELPPTPFPHKSFIQHVTKHEGSIEDLLVPFSRFESRLREGFAVHPQHPAIQDPCVNLIPVFGESNEPLRIRARPLEDDSVNGEYIMPLKPEDRRASGTLAMVGSLKAFKQNFNIFSESSLVDLDWSNVVAAGSSVVTPLIPVPTKYNTSKKALRGYYHQKLAPSSDIDLFIWGLDEAAATAKIKYIESSIRDAILDEVTTIRTKNAITIVSRYPTRHIQIVLRLYKSISEILTGFDVDCSSFAYDGTQVYGTPRAITAFVTQTNTIDLTRRSPSYESRLSKYAHRGFEIHWPDLDRTKIDPTIFERSFPRTNGLARLLVLERLPKPNDREAYLIQRREERGRPNLNSYHRFSHQLVGNLKDNDPDDVAEWVYEDEVANYHSFTIPYGPKYHAKRIEKLLYTKDLLLNAEWNAKKDRKVALHRHPCFIGDAESVIHDCCGFCPKPTTEEERKIAKEESGIYVSGELSFLKDDPGRQAIGSFNPLTSDDWTDMAYIGGTGELCRKICHEDIDYVKDWCLREGSKINRRDHTGRTPLQLATQCSTPEIVQCLIDNGARIVARLVDGMTALHIAATRGNSEMVRSLLEKSNANEAVEAEKEDRTEEAPGPTRHDGDTQRDDVSETGGEGTHSASEDEDMEDFESDESDESTTLTQGSFVKVRATSDGVTLPDDEGENDPDFYDVNLVAWDTPVSPLHLAVLGGHVDVIELLVSTFGADPLLPVKLVDSYSRNPKTAILTLVLAAKSTDSDLLNVTKTLLSLGASSAQADMNRISALHYIIATRCIPALEACFSLDQPAAKGALNHLIVENLSYNTKTLAPLTTAISTGDESLVNMLLALGAKPTIELEDFVLSYTAAFEQHGTKLWGNTNDITRKYKETSAQPIVLAVEHNLPNVVYKLLEQGADVNTITQYSHIVVACHEKNERDYRNYEGNSLLDLINKKIEVLQKKAEDSPGLPEPVDLGDDKKYLGGLVEGSYEHWQISKELQAAKNHAQEWHQKRREAIRKHETRKGRKEECEAWSLLIGNFQTLRQHVVEAGALTFTQIYPDIPMREDTKSLKRIDESFEPRVSFEAFNITDKSRESYLQLFEAAWNGDGDKIKELTLAPWGPEGKNCPLQIAVPDTKGFSPFTLAVIRQHLDVADLILTIADAQHVRTDEESQRRQYSMEGFEEDSVSSEGEPVSEVDDLNISYRLVSETFTINDITALPKSVASKVSVTSLLSWHAETWMALDEPEKVAANMLGYTVTGPSPPASSNQDSKSLFTQSLEFRHQRNSLVHFALKQKSLDLLRFLLQCSKKASKLAQKDESKSLAGFDRYHFQIGLEQGNIQAITEMVKGAGVQLPIKAFVKHTGVKEAERPKYYPGLSIGGKKMTKWAQERDHRYTTDFENEKTPPLLLAAHSGCLATTEWFLSDIPSRLYKEFGADSSEDPRLKILAKAPQKYSQAVDSWLHRRSNLALHAAVLSKAKDDQSLEVVRYLIEAMPESMETKSQTGYTPLSLAFHRGKVDVAKVLIAAGADQTIRDDQGRNIVHLILCDALDRQVATDSAKVRSLLDLIDKRVLKSLFLERCHDNPGSTTPLARWLWHNSSDIWREAWHTHNIVNRRSPEVFQVILEYGGGHDLYMMDGSGQFPLHQAVKTGTHQVIALMLQHDPNLLWRENATGQTPLELAESLYIRHHTGGNPDLNPKLDVDRAPTELIAGRARVSWGPEPGKEGVMETWRVCKESAASHPGPRKLITVTEAREVTKRLADRNQSDEAEKSNEDEEDSSEIGEFQDEVADWLESY